MKKNGAKMNEMNSSDLITEIEKRFERHTNILIEKMDSNVKTVTEQYSGLAKQISEVKSDVNDLKEDMAIVKPAVERQGKDLREIKSELHSVKMAMMDVGHAAKDHDKRIAKLEEKVFV